MGHFGLLTATEGALSKRLGSTGMAEFRDGGIEPIALVALLARLGTSAAIEPVATLDPLIASFDLAHLGRSHPRFDPGELAHLNARIVHHLPFEAVAGRLPDGMCDAAWDAIRPNLTTVAEAGDWWQVVAGPVVAEHDPDDQDFLISACRELAALTWDNDIWRTLTEALKTSSGRKGKSLFLPLRRALTGRDHGPEMAALLPLIGRDRALQRLDL